jgi:hypothetical protein
MKKLSEARLKELINEEIALEIESSEKMERVETNKREIDRKIKELKSIYSSASEDSSLEEVSIASVANVAYTGAGDVWNAATGEGDLSRAIEQFAKDKIIDYGLGKIGLPHGPFRGILKSFIEELTLVELYDFIDEPECEKFASHSMDALIDYFVDSSRPWIDKLIGLGSRLPGGKITATILGDIRGTDIISKILSGVGTEYVSEWLKNDPMVRNYIEVNIVPAACVVWDNVWEALDLEDATMTLSKALDDAYPDTFKSAEDYLK